MNSGIKLFEALKNMRKITLKNNVVKNIPTLISNNYDQNLNVNFQMK